MAEHNKANIIKTQFWIKSLLDAFEYNTVAKLAKLTNFSWGTGDVTKDKDSFFYQVSKVCPDIRKAKKAYDLLISTPINESNWYKYKNGKQPITDKKVGVIEAFKILVPESGEVLDNGKHNLLAILGTCFVGDAVVYFKRAVDAFYETHNLEYGVGDIQSQLLGIGDLIETENLVGKQEFHRRFVDYFNKADFHRAFEIYGLLIFPSPNSDFSILDLAKKVIGVNFFGRDCQVLANELHLTLEDLMNSDTGRTEQIRYKRCAGSEPATLNYLEKEYGINKQLWIDSYRIFKYANNIFSKPQAYTETERNQMNNKEVEPIHFEGSQVIQRSTGFKFKRAEKKK